MAIQCPGCRTPLNVDQSHGWPYIRSAVQLHLDVCRKLPCRPEDRERCAEAIADRVASTSGDERADQPFRCPLDQCEPWK